MAKVKINIYADKYVSDIYLIKHEFCVLMSKQRKNTILVSKIANRIKQLREEKGISQDSFFIDTEIHIARIESGRSNITVSTLSAICDYFGISLRDFFKEI